MIVLISSVFRPAIPNKIDYHLESLSCGTKSAILG